MDSIQDNPSLSSSTLSLQRALAESSWEQLRVLIPLLQPHVALVDLPGRQYVAASDAYSNLFQLPDEGGGLDDVHPLALSRQLQGYLDRVQKDSVECRGELALPLDDYELSVQFSACPVRNRAGHARGALICVQARQAFSYHRRLAAEHSLINRIIDMVPELIYYKNASGVYERCNRAFCDRAGLRHEEIIGARARDVLPSELADVAERGDQQVLTTGRPWTHEGWVREPGRGQIYYRIHKQPLFAPNGEISGIVAVALDLTEEQLVQQKLSEASLMFETVSDACLVLTERGQIRAANPAARQLLGLREGDDTAEVDRFVARVDEESTPFSSRLEEGVWQGEVLISAGNRQPMIHYANLQRVAQGQGGECTALLILTDPQKLGATHSRLVHRAYHDPLTGLPNRELVRARLEHSIHQSSRQQTHVAVLYLDLDGFKQVNDRFGHLSGDRLLVDLANAMLGQVRQGDTLGRVGGDEFIVVLEQVEEMEDIQRVCGKLMAAVTSVECCGRQGMISASIGVSISPDDGGDVDTLIDRADQAMYSAKRGGRAEVCYYSSLTGL